jgi:hypothetical protein
MEVWARLTQFGIHPQYFDRQPMIAKRPSLLQRFSVTCLAQLMRNYNWICSCINKTAPRTGLFCCVRINHEAAHAGRAMIGRMRIWQNSGPGAFDITFRGTPL